MRVGEGDEVDVKGVILRGEVMANQITCQQLGPTTNHINAPSGSAHVANPNGPTLSQILVGTLFLYFIISIFLISFNKTKYVYQIILFYNYFHFTIKLFHKSIISSSFQMLPRPLYYTPISN